jgi:hypothetical protein
MRNWRTWFIGVLCTLVLMGVMSMYLQPTFLMTLANQMWSCF